MEGVFWYQNRFFLPHIAACKMIVMSSQEVVTMEDSSDDGKPYASSAKKKQKLLPVTNDQCKTFYLDNPGENQIPMLLAMCFGCKLDDKMFADCDNDTCYKAAKNKRSFKPSLAVCKTEVVCRHFQLFPNDKKFSDISEWRNHVPII